MCRDCAWEDAVESIEEMLDDKDFEFASETLEGILNWVKEKEHITTGQETAIANIRRGGRR